MNMDDVCAVFAIEWVVVKNALVSMKNDCNVWMEETIQRLYCEFSSWRDTLSSGSSSSPPFSQIQFPFGPICLHYSLSVILLSLLILFVHHRMFSCSTPLKKKNSKNQKKIGPASHRNRHYPTGTRTQLSDDC